MRLRFAPLSNRPDAIPLIAHWWCDEWGLPRRHESLDAYLKGIAGIGPEVLPLHVLAMSDEGVVGVATLKDKSVLQERFPGYRHWLSGVYVPPALRGKGIATALCLEMAAISRGRGVSGLYLQTEALDGGLYAKLGWRPLHRVHLGGSDLLIMVKNVRSTGSAA